MLAMTDKQINAVAAFVIWFSREKSKKIRQVALN
jgi:hypothetical protein